MEDLVGFRLCPTEDEMVGYLLYYKLMQMEVQANYFINEINIYNYDPWISRLESGMKSRDSFCYFYTRVDNNTSGRGQKRSTKSGFWGITGKDKDIIDRLGVWSGNQGGVIGFKKILRFHIGKTRNNGLPGDWIIHEYHNTMVSQDMRTHVLCRMEYKGDDIRFLCDDATEMTPTLVQEPTLVDQSLAVLANQIQHVGGDLNTEEQVPVLALNRNELETVWNPMVEGDFAESETWMDQCSSFEESKCYLKQVCFDYSPLNSSEFTNEPSI